MKHAFAQIPSADIQRSAFDLSHSYKTTFDSGYLIPFYCREILPGTTIDLKAAILARMSTPIVPVADNIYLDTQFFFVPNRLVWQHWVNMQGEQRNPSDTIDYLTPTVQAGSEGFEVGSIADYFGIPTGVPNLKVNALPFRAVNLIFNEWYRDENLQDSVPDNFGDGPDNIADYKLLRRGKRKDYYTSSLPWPQKFNSVTLPLGEQAYVYGTGQNFALTNNNNFVSMFGTSQGAEFKPSNNPWATVGSAATGTTPVSPTTLGVPTKEQVGSNTPAMYADLQFASTISVNALRMSFQLQRLYERDARGGSRYVEILLSHFGVVSPDARLQRPEFLGGSSSPISINPVQQTSASDATTPQGNLAAYAVCADSIPGFKKSFTEHGFVIGFCSVRCDLSYQQGLHKMWTRDNRYSYYMPVLAHLGEQAVLSKELYCDGSADDESVFGYQERWAEYRFAGNMITGKLRSTDPQSLDIWHLAQKFDSRPVLNADFIEDKPPIKRILAVQDEPEFIMDTYFKETDILPMPVYSVPGLVDHF